jgi:hypothetical protein
LAQAIRGNASSYSHSQWQTPTSNGKTKPSDGTGQSLIDQARTFPNWPTPRAEDSECCGNHPNAMDSLTGAVKMWGTPRVTTNGGIPCPEHTGKGSRLEDQVALWPMPMAGTKTRTAQGGIQLHQAVDNWPTPRASANENRTTRRAPSHGQDHGKCLAAEAAEFHPRDFISHYLPQGQVMDNGFVVSSTRRRLNPRFVEWLMGWPLGYTHFDCPLPEMEWSHWLRHMRLCLCGLLSKTEGVSHETG